MKKILLASFVAAFSLQAKAQTFTHATVPVTGFNADVISDGSGTVISTAPQDIDGVGFNLVAQNYINPANQTPVAFLPTGGLINSLLTTGLNFQLASYNANNSLRITTTSNTDTLKLVTPRTAHKLNLLVTSAYGCTFTATVNFTDGTSEAFTGNMVQNWFDGTSFVAARGFGRVKRADNAIENPASNPRLYQYTLSLNVANTTKLIQSIKFTKTTTAANEILHVFAVTASTLMPYDIGISAITAPTSPVLPGVSQPVIVTVKNFGATPLTAATLGFKVDGTTVVNNFAFTASPALNTNDISAPVTIGNFNFPAGTRKIKAWTSLPNGVADGMATNDTLLVTLNACNSLSGNYTINQNAPASATNYQSFALAQAALNSCGVSGPVTFTVAPNTGPYNEQVILSPVNGASATNTINFEGSGNTITFSPTTSNPAIFSLNGADYFKINNFNIVVVSNATVGWGVQLKTNADNNIISNNTIDLPISSALSTMNGIVFGTSTASTSANGANNLIQNNTINGGYYSISLTGNTNAVGSNGNQVKNNIIKDSYLYALYMSNASNTIVEGNDISRPTRTNAGAFNGIYMINTCTGTQIRKNKVHNTNDVSTTMGIVYAYFSNSAGAVGSENVFSNNLAYNLNNTGNAAYGFYNNGASNTWYFHNTVVDDNPAISHTTLRGMWFNSTGTNVKFINNNLSLPGNASSKHLIYLGNTGINLVSSNNNLYKGTSGNIGYYGGDKVTFADWKAANTNAYDQNSVSENPIFVNAATGNFQPSASPINNIGQPVASITDDITGVTRNTTTPDPGAYEFGPVANDAGISAILTPNSGCGLTNQEVVSVTLNNYGSAPQSNIPVSYTINGGTPVTETYTGQLAPGTSVTYTFTTKANLSVPNTYTIAVQTALTGDQITSNDAITSVINAIPLVTSYPYVENFETFNGGWLPGGTASSWAWGTPAKAVINSAASGTKTYVTGLTASYNYNEKSQVVGPCFNFTSLTAPIFEMKAWWNSEFSVDGAVLQSSIDNGATWQIVGAKNDPNNWYNDNSLGGAPGGQPAASAQGWTGRNSSSNGSNGWVTVKHALTGLGGQSNVKLRIAFGSDAAVNDDGFAFDDVMIYETPSTDGAVTAITSPNSGCGLSNQETVSISVKNQGGTILSNIPVSFKVDNGAFVNEVIVGPIAAGVTATYTFTAKANLSAVGAHTIVAKTAVPGDNVTVNDTLAKIVNTIPVISTFPYNEGFENGHGGWFAGGTASSWALGTPAKPVINSAGGGTKSWVTSLTGNHFVNEKSYVVSPCIDLTGKPDPDFEMKAWWNSDFSKDGAVLQSSINGGATWQVVGAMGDPNNWYNDNSIDGGPGGQLTTTALGWTGRNATNNGSGGWKTVKHKLTGLGGQSSVLLRIAFGADNATQDDGFAFDDVRIIDNTNNLSLTAITPINKVCGMSATEPISVTIQNHGQASVSGFTVTYTINGGNPVTENFTGSIQGGASANFTFSQTANFYASGTYAIEATVTKTGDPDATNNSASYTVTNSTFAALPPVFDFEPAGNGITQLTKVSKSKAGISEGTGASNGNGTKGMILDGVTNAAWVIPAGTLDPWTSNPEHFSGAYICFNPTGGPASQPLWLSFDLKQLYKGANANTNFRVTVNGQQVGATYRPPFSGSPINWQRINVDLSAYKNLSSIQIGFESSVKEEFANGAGTANLIDNITVSRSLQIGVNENLLTAQLHIFPNPSAGIFMVDLPQGKTYQLEVTDLTGKQIQSLQGNGKVKLNLNSAAKGVYLLKVSGEIGTAVRKLILE